MRLLQLGSALICVLLLKLGATENSAEATCPEDSLPCDDGLQCVKRNEWCAGDKHCLDESDEAYCKKKKWWGSPNPNECEDNTHFICDDGRCVPRVAKCDGQKDCSDGSDEKCEPDPTDDNNEYYPDPEETTTEHSISEKNVDAFVDDIPNTTSASTLAPTPMGTSDVPIPSSTIPLDIIVRENEEVPTHAPISVSTPYARLRTSTTPMSFYAKRLEDESRQSIVQTRSSSVPSYLPPVTTETMHVLEGRQRQDARTTTTTSRPLSPTTIRSTISHNFNPRYDRTQAPITHPTRSYNSRGRFDRSSITTSQPTRSYDSRTPDQRRASFTHPTRSYVALASSHDPRRGSYQHSTQPTRNYEQRRDPYQQNTPPTRPYDSRRDPYLQNTPPTRPYDSRRDPYQHQTLSSFPSRYTHNPYQSSGELTIRTTTPGTRYPAVTHRVYLDHGTYYGYYDDDGRFVMLRASGRDQKFYWEPHNVGPRNEQTTRYPLYVTPTPIAFTRHLTVPSRFYFAKNYASIYGDNNHSYLRKGKAYILSLRNVTGDWGVETPRALVALSLINNSFFIDTYENDMMQKYLQVFLGTSLLRGDTKTTTLSRLAMAINGLLATCHNPRDFHGADLTELIRKELFGMNHGRTRKAPVNPSVYLSLCLADKELTHIEVHDLMGRLNAHSTPEEYSKGMLSLSIMAFSCHLQQQQLRDSEYYRSLQSLLSNATSKLLDEMLDDGSFGSVYSTALAAQALISVNDSKQWNAESTFDFLKQQQLKDGSFGDFLATYWTLPVLSGRSLLHLRNTRCKPPKENRVLTPSEIMDFTGPKQHIRYSLYIGYPNVNGNSVKVLVPQGISFFDIMRVAEIQNSAFKFSYEEKNEQIHVYSISNVPNDSERGFQWNLYVKRSTDPDQTRLNNQERVTGDVRDFYPRSDQHVIFWYHPSDIHS